jgi:hypothetical protein
MKGIVSGIILCRDTPTNQCSRCSLHYYYEHVKTYFHPSTTAAVVAPAAAAEEGEGRRLF